MKVQYKVINLGLNELGVKEINEFYKTNIKKNFFKEVKLGYRIGKSSKLFKQEKSFLGLKDENDFDFVDCTSCDNGKYFRVLLKHINYKIVKLEVVEKELGFVF